MYLGSVIYFGSWDEYGSGVINRPATRVGEAIPSLWISAGSAS